MSERMGYLVQSTLQQVSRQGLGCPSCGTRASVVLSRKWLVTELRRCERCRLLFRAPVTPAARAERYYQSAYESGMTTAQPSDDELADLRARRFEGTEKCFARYVALLRALGVEPGARVLDYGCSWGYGTWQLGAAGFEAAGFELSRPRAEYAASKLGVDVRSELIDAWQGSFDVVFSAHVLEHVPSVADAFESCSRLLKAGGRSLFVAITPNGSLARQWKDPVRWQNAWGHKHPNLLDEEFWQQLLDGRDRIITSDLVSLAPLADWARHGGSQIGPLDGGELLAACRL